MKKNTFKTLAFCLLAIGICLFTMSAKKKYDVEHPARMWYHGSAGITDEALKQIEEDHTVYVNTKAPGVHCEYDPVYEENVWRDGMGNYLCRDRNMAPLEDIDKNFYFTGDKDSPWVKHVYDSDRDCMVWRSVPNGDFLGRDEPTTSETSDWLSSTDEKWYDKGKIPQGKDNTPNVNIAQHNAPATNGSTASASSSTDGKDEVEAAARKAKEREQAILSQQEKEQKEQQQKDKEKREAEAKLKQTDAEMAKTDAEMAKAKAELQKARQELRSLGMGEYEGLLNEAEAAINQGQAASQQYKNKRKK